MSLSNFFRRRHKFIHPGAQLAIALEIIAHSLLFPIMLLVAFYVPPFSQVLPAVGIAADREVSLSFAKLCLHKWPIITGLLGVIAMMSIIFSHRLVGPVYRFAQVLKKMQGGDLTIKTSLRRGDYFSHTATLFDQLTERFRNTVVLAEAQQKKALAIAQKLQNHDNDEIKRLGDELRREMEVTGKELRSYLV